MKRAYLIHGWSGNPTHGFFPWLKAELEARGYVVEASLSGDNGVTEVSELLRFVDEAR